MTTVVATRGNSLAKASKDLMLTEPFYGLFLMMLNKDWDNRVPTAGVSKNGINYQLKINEDFWGALTPIFQRNILKHELLHIAFFHLERRDEFPQHDVANIAMDIEVNQYIDRAGLPEGAQYPDTYPELNLELKKGTKYYYDKLLQASKKCPGEDGYCQKLMDQLAAMAKSPCKGGDGDPTVCDHPTWGEFDGMSEADKKLMHSQTDFHLKEVAEQVKKTRGTIPGELAGYIEALDYKEPPKFNWKGYLRRFAGGSHKTYTKKLHRKFNKRFEDNPGLKIKQRRHVLVAVDISGSVSAKELKEFFHEIHHIHRNGSDVTVVQCDAAISNITPIKRGLEDKIKLFGRGGTDFQPVINYYNENQHKYTCLIYFTDGECSAPQNPRGKILWVLSEQSNFNDNLPGLTIQLN